MCHPGIRTFVHLSSFWNTDLDRMLCTYDTTSCLEELLLQVDLRTCGWSFTSCEWCHTRLTGASLSFYSHKPEDGQWQMNIRSTLVLVAGQIHHHHTHWIQSMFGHSPGQSAPRTATRARDPQLYQPCHCVTVTKVSRWVDVTSSGIFFFARSSPLNQNPRTSFSFLLFTACFPVSLLGENSWEFSQPGRVIESEGGLSSCPSSQKKTLKTSWLSFQRFPCTPDLNVLSFSQKVSEHWACVCGEMGKDRRLVSDRWSELPGPSP